MELFAVGYVYFMFMLLAMMFECCRLFISCSEVAMWLLISALHCLLFREYLLARRSVLSKSYMKLVWFCMQIHNIILLTCFEVSCLMHIVMFLVMYLCVSYVGFLCILSASAVLPQCISHASCSLRIASCLISCLVCSCVEQSLKPRPSTRTRLLPRLRTRSPLTIPSTTQQAR